MRVFSPFYLRYAVYPYHGLEVTVIRRVFTVVTFICGNIHYRLSVIELRRSRAVQQLLPSRHSVQRCSAVSRRAAVLAQSGNSARQTVPTRQPVQ